MLAWTSLSLKRFVCLFAFIFYSLRSSHGCLPDNTSVARDYAIHSNFTSGHNCHYMKHFRSNRNSSQEERFILARCLGETEFNVVGMVDCSSGPSQYRWMTEPFTSQYGGIGELLRSATWHCHFHCQKHAVFRSITPLMLALCCSYYYYSKNLNEKTQPCRG